MKKTFTTSFIVGLLVTALYVAIAFNWLIAHHYLINTNLWSVTYIDLFILTALLGSSAFSLLIDLDRLRTITKGDLSRGTLDRNFYYNLYPLVARFTLFLVRNKALLYVMLVLPGVYFTLRMMLLVLGKIAEWITDAVYWIGCKWDDFTFWLSLRF